jgi:hypothetical protein
LQGAETRPAYQDTGGEYILGSVQRLASKHNLSRKDRLRGLLWLAIMVAAVLYGIYLGIWLLQQEERNNSMQFKNAGIEYKSRF